MRWIGRVGGIVRVRKCIWKLIFSSKIFRKFRIGYPKCEGGRVDWVFNSLTQRSDFLVEFIIWLVMVIIITQIIADILTHNIMSFMSIHWSLLIVRDDWQYVGRRNFRFIRFG